MTSKLWTEEQFNCPVCLDLPNDPATIPCGHSYCMACIKDYWSKDDPKGIYSCPQCRQTFCPKPPLSRNTMLAEAVEQLRTGALKANTRNDSIRSVRSAASSSSVKSKMSSSAVPCDMCKGKQRAAVKSCLVCMSSYCESHLKPHQTQKALKQHELSPPIRDLAEKICTAHKYLQEFFCRPCKMFVCWLCTSNQHKGHECVSTKAERTEKQKLFGDIQAENSQKLKEREQELKDMKKMMEGVKRSVDRVYSDTEQTLSELQKSVERLQDLLEDMMDRANRDKMGQAQEAVDSLEAEIKELRQRDTEMKDLSRCEDHIHYLQTFESLCSPLEAGEIPSVHANHDATFDPICDAVLDLREKVEDLCNQELGKMSKQVSDTTLFTLGANRGGTKGGAILKLFSGLGSRNTNNRSPASTPSISSGVRSGERRGLGNKGPDVRGRDSPRADSSPRPRQRQRVQERESVRETNSRPNPSPVPSPTPSRKESRSPWSRSSSQSLSVPSAVPTHNSTPPSPAPVQTAPQAATSAPAGGFSRMASISSIFRSRRGTNQATPATTNSFGGGMSTVPESPIEVNPGLFLDDSPTTETMNFAAAFPGLREISLDSIQAPEPRSREEFLQYAVSLTLDPTTAHKRLVLSESNTKAVLQSSAQPCPDSPQRFDGWTQVLCQSALYSPRSYWEVDWRGRGSSVGVVYGSISRKGADARSGLGYNAQSWTLELSDTCCAAMHDNQKKDIPVSYSPRVGVFVDTSGGMLSFYSVAESMTLLHTFRANFTQPLYPAFGVGSGVGVGLDFALGQFSSSTDSIKLCPM